MKSGRPEALCVMVGCIVAAIRRVGMPFHHVISDGVESLLDPLQTEGSTC